jgi:phosphodiesterase/alkaline phosphatase D-like protein
VVELDLFPDGELETAAELGAIDERSVRVWVRSPHCSRVVGELLVSGRDAVTAEINVSAETDWTGALVFSLPSPAPSTDFTCRVAGHELRGRFAPPPGSASGLTFGFGSCHLPFLERKDQLVVSDVARGMYPAMLREMSEARAERLLLLGDQVYADALDPVSVLDDLPGDSSRLPPVAETLDRYRRVYRGFFGEAGMRRIRAQFPTSCVWDDGDVVDNWGSVHEDPVLGAHIFAAASRAYCEYQHARNPGGRFGDPPYHYTMQYGDIGFFVLDLRGVRNASRQQLMGETQWEALTSYLTGEAAREIATLFIVSSVPIEHGSRWFTRLGERLPAALSGPVRERWVSRNFVDSRDVLLDALFAWQAQAARRQVIVLSGDVHCASAFTITRRDGPGVIEQFTSSAMTTPFKLKQTFFNRIAVRAPNLFERRYRFQRRLLSISHNYGIVRVTPLREGGHRVTATIRAWDERGGRMRTAGRVIATPQ